MRVEQPSLIRLHVFQYPVYSVSQLIICALVMEKYESEENVEFTIFKSKVPHKNHSSTRSFKPRCVQGLNEFDNFELP